MDFTIKNGPWNKLFEGRVQGHLTEIYSNPNNFLLSFIFEEKEGEKTGALIEAFKVFYCDGEIEALADNLKKESLTIMKSIGPETLKFFLIDSGPVFANFNQEDFTRETDAVIETIEEDAISVELTAESYDTKLIELNKASDKAKALFYSLPLSALLFSPHEKKRISESTIEPISHGKIIFGLTKQGQVITEPLSLFKKTMIFSGTEKERSNLLRIFIESALLSESPAIVFDWINDFSGLNSPNNQELNISKFMPGFEPMGFQSKKFMIPKDLHVDLSMLTGEEFTQLFNFGKTPASKIIIEALNEKPGNLRKIYELIEKKPISGKFNEFEKERALRLIKLSEITFGKFFGEKNNFEKICSGSKKGINSASIISLHRLDALQCLTLFDTSLKELIKYWKNNESQNQVKCFVFLPEAQRIFGLNEELDKSIAESITMLDSLGVGVVFSADERNLIPKEILKTIYSTVNIIKGKDISIKISDRKNYRATLRPSLSSVSESKRKDFQEIRL